MQRVFTLLSNGFWCLCCNVKNQHLISKRSHRSLEESLRRLSLEKNTAFHATKKEYSSTHSHHFSSLFVSASAVYYAVSFTWPPSTCWAHWAPPSPLHSLWRQHIRSQRPSLLGPLRQACTDPPTRRGSWHWAPDRRNAKWSRMRERQETRRRIIGFRHSCVKQK